MKINCTRHADVLEIRLEGELDAENVRELNEIFRSGEGKGVTRFVMNLARLEYIDSSGLGAFVKQMKAARQQGGDVKIAAPSEEVRKVLELTRLNRVFDVRENSEEARDQFYTVS